MYWYTHTIQINIISSEHSKIGIFHREELVVALKPEVPVLSEVLAPGISAKSTAAFKTMTNQGANPDWT